MLRSLFDSPAAPLVDEVWSWEAVHHGDAALVNAGNLSGIGAVVASSLHWSGPT